MKKLNILLVIIIINFLSINFAFAKSECDEILSNKMAMSMTTGVGKMFFNGYNHAKGSNFKYLGRCFLMDITMRKDQILNILKVR